MLLSEYIDKLRVLLASHGDVPVVQETRDEMRDADAAAPEFSIGRVWIA